jgi:alpha-beta hydrolase superfamily lysophospholipase
MSYSPGPDQTEALTMPDQTQLYVHIWKAASQPKAVMLFLHGMAEHARRYASFFDRVRMAGWTSYAPDLRGHGLTADGHEQLGIAGPDGWNVVICGYSMGSMLVQRLMQVRGDDFNGAILIGSGGPLPGGLQRLVVAIKEEIASGRNSPSAFLRASFLAYNDPFQPAVTNYDWLSRDQAAVREYVADAFCGIPLSCGLVTDYASALLKLFQEYERVPAGLPVLMLNGLEDTSSPLEGFNALVATLAELEMSYVSWRLYAGARHDLLHETNCDEVMEDILSWKQSLLR